MSGTKITELQINMAKIETSLENIKETNEKILRRLDNLPASFANKWVEKAVLGMLGIMGTATATFVFWLFQLILVK